MLPEVKAPEKKPVLKKRLLWTAAILILFYILGAIPIIGIQPSSFEQLRLFQDLLASNIGTIMTLGIGPIVLASIVLQLLIGGKFINMDLSNPQDRARFTGMQKLLTIVIAFFEAGAYTGFGLGPSLITPNEGMFIPVLLQVVIGAIIVMYLDEVVSKYGIGSGVGLFIAAGVSQGFFWQLFSPPGLGRAVLFQIFENIASGKVIIALTLIIPIFFAIAIFAAVTFAEGMHINIPIAMGPKGFGGRFPVKLMYVSNMPVILASALFANIQIMSSVITGDNILAMIIKGLSWITQIPRIDSYSILEALLVLGPSQRVFIEILHGVVYIAILVVLCVVFGKFWVELGGQSTESVSNQLQRSGMYIPGFRRDPRIIQGVLNRYIPPVTVLGSIFVGLLAGLSDIITG